MRILFVLLLTLLFHGDIFADWMKDQIYEDLAPFKTQGVKQSDIQRIAALLQQKHPFLYVKIENKKVSFFAPQASFNQARARVLKRFFKTLASHHPLPELEFLISLDDSFDELDIYSVPLFVFAKHLSSSKRVLIPDFEAMKDADTLLLDCNKAALQHPWQSKKELIFWRGGSSGGADGVYAMNSHNYRDFPRVKLVFLSREHPDWLDAGFSSFCQSTQDVFDAISREGRPLCPFVPMKDHFAYKYLLDIDGNSCTYSRCRWILLSNSTLLKPASPNIQWYYKTLRPYIHYVPIQEDLNDLYDKYQWLQEHDDQAFKIAEEGRKLGEKIFSKTAVEEYFLILLNEYAKIYKKSE